MKKQDYECLEECFGQLWSAYQESQEENKELKETIEYLKSLCLANNIEIPVIEDYMLF
jgi:hypothetical protein